MGTSLYTSVPLSTPRYLRVPLGTSWYLLVPLGTSDTSLYLWYLLVLLGTSRYLSVPLNTSLFPLCPSRDLLGDSLGTLLAPLGTPSVPTLNRQSKVHLYNCRVGWVNLVPQHVNKQTNKGNTLALIATADYKTNHSKKSTVI